MGYNNKVKCIEFLKAPVKDWSQAKIMIFDAPQEVDQPYSARINNLEHTIPSSHSILKVAAFVECKDKQHMNTFFAEVCAKGAEGIVLRDPSAWYFKPESFLKKTVLYLVYYN
jgi:DNA ligase-1